MKKLYLLILVSASMFVSCTKDSVSSESKPAFNKNKKVGTYGVSQIASSTPTITGNSNGTVTVDSVVKTVDGTFVFFTVNTTDLPILSSSVMVKSDSTHGSWSSIGSGQWGSVWYSPFATNVFDGYVKSFPQGRVYYAAVTTNSGSITSAEYVVN